MPSSDSYLAWIAGGVEEALEANDVRWAKRWLSKLWEVSTCMYCRNILDDERPYHNHFKGFVHDECSEKYDGRMDYENQHGINVSAPRRASA